MTVSPASRIRLHPLSLTEEGDGSWIVGRMETGEFVQLPAEGVTFLRALMDGTPVGGAAAGVQRQHGADVDAADFVGQLFDLGFVAAIDGEPTASPARQPSLPWLRPGLVGWAFRPSVRAVLAAFVLACAGLAAARGELVPAYRAFFITSSPGVDLALNMAIFGVVIASHEFWHLAAARSEGAFARFGLGTRLHILVAQTTVSGLWGLPPRSRRRVYLAGLGSDLTILAGCYLAVSVTRAPALVHRLVDAMILGLLLGVAYQCEIFMRTDLYFVVQDLLKCKDLYADAVRYTRFVMHRMQARVARRPAPADPTAELPGRERTPVRLYAGLMVLGSLVALALFAGYEGPIWVVLMIDSARRAAAGWSAASPVKLADGLCAFGVELAANLLFLRLFAAKHGPKLRRLTRVARRPGLGLRAGRGSGSATRAG
jgi:hypothetical protein